MDTESEESSSDEESDHRDLHNHNRHYHSNLEAATKLNRSVTMKAIIEQENIKANRVATLVGSVSVASDQAAATNLLKQIKQHQQQKNSATTNTTNSNANGSVKLPSMNINNNKNNNITGVISSPVVETEDEIIANNHTEKLTVAALKLLYELEIKFPGKTSQQTTALLQKFYAKFEASQSKLGNYWMAKLDDAKRIKILNIVKTNCTVILQKVFTNQSVENVRLYKIINRLLNRLLWSHGQGLWNCFTAAAVNSSK